MTAGQHGGRDYGHDYQTHPPYPPAESDREAGWDTRYSEWGEEPAGRRMTGNGGHPDARRSSYAGQSPYRPSAPYSGQPPYPSRSPYPARTSYPPPAADPSYGSYPDRRQAPVGDYPNRWPGSDEREEPLGAPRYRTALRPRGERAQRPGAGTPDGGEPGKGRRRRRGLPLWQELPLLLIIAFCLAILVRTFLLQAFYIPSGSMEDTLVAGDRVLVNKVVYQFREPVRGEVVVFRGTDEWAPEQSDEGDVGALARIGRVLGDLVGVSRPSEKDFIKRVIGLPGDTVSCCDVDGRVSVNGQPLDELYVIRNSPLAEGSVGANDCRTRQFDEVVVRPGHMFVMGDHREVSQDSRCQGQVPIDNIIGRAFVIVWPSGRWDSLSQPDTFDNVPPSAIAAGSSIVPVPGHSGALASLLPLLLPFGWTVRWRRRRRLHGARWRDQRRSRWRDSARSRPIGRTGRRSVCRLAE